MNNTMLVHVKNSQILWARFNHIVSRPPAHLDLTITLFDNKRSVSLIIFHFVKRRDPPPRFYDGDTCFFTLPEVVEHVPELAPLFGGEYF